MFDNIDTSTLSGAVNGGTQMLILGILMVFSVLGVIFLALQAFHFACNLFIKKADKKEVAEPAPVAVVQTNDEEIVAVIAAAIAAAENDTPNARFRVVSFKRVS